MQNKKAIDKLKTSTNREKVFNELMKTLIIDTSTSEDKNTVDELEPSQTEKQVLRDNDTIDESKKQELRNKKTDTKVNTRQS